MQAFETVINAAQSYLPSLNESRLRTAFEFADKAHAGQIRKDGETPYIMHPVSAAQILTGLRVDEDTLIAALLHDVPEDTKYTLKDIEKSFGKTVAFLVEGITKLSKVHYRNDMAERQIESLKKLFIHSASDPRIILIKLADRLHNMRTIGAIQRVEKRVRIAKETLEIFVPIANLLGMWDIKNQLEDLCFQVLAPKDYAKIDELVKKSILHRKNLIEKTTKEVEDLLRRAKLHFVKVEGRQKTYYSTFRKMLRSGKSFGEIYDLVGLRIIVEDVGACYQALGIIHQNYTPKVGRLKDYIALPKSNGYQSIHTTVFGLEGTVTEVQIRTQDMHLENEYGVAAHYFYRHAKEREQKAIQERLQKKYDWVQKILDLQRDANDNDNKKFFQHLKLDIFTDRIFVFTQKGDVIDLPQGSCVIDFAYHIHTDIGMLAVDANINGKKCPITTKLRNGDVVYVNTSEEAQGPQVEWLNVVRTTLARNRIREYLKERDRTSLINDAEKTLDNKLKTFGFAGVDAISKLQKVIVLEEFHLDSWEDLLLQIGEGNINSRDVIHLLYSEKELLGKEKAPLSMKAYDRKPKSRLTELTRKKVRKIKLLVELTNHVGALEAVCHELADLNINILKVSTLYRKGDGRFCVKFTLEVDDFEHYEKAIYSLQRTPEVESVRVQYNQSVTKTGANMP